MKRINLEIYDQKDLLEVLDFALEEYQFSKSPMKKYWIMRIKQLKRVIEGRVNPPSMERR